MFSYAYFEKTGIKILSKIFRKLLRYFRKMEIVKTDMEIVKTDFYKISENMFLGIFGNL